MRTELSSSTNAGIAAVLVGGSTLGLAAIFVRWAQPASPLVVGFYRMLFALPLVALLLARSGAPRPSGQARGWAIVAGVCFVGDLWTWHLALGYTSVANATLLLGLTPLWVALFGWWRGGAALGGRYWLGLGGALCGVAVLGFAKGARLGGGLGELMAAAASIFYAIFTLCLSRARRGATAPQALWWVVLSCTVGFALLGAATGAPFSGFSARAWWSFAGLGVVVQVAAWWLISWGLGHVAPSLGAVALLTQGSATVLLGWLLLGESVTPTQAVGIALLFAGIFTSTRDAARAAPTIVAGAAPNRH